MPPSSPEAPRRDRGFLVGSLLVPCVALVAWAWWDVRHPDVSTAYAHYFIARDADCLDGETLAIEVGHLPWHLAFGQLARDRRPGECYVGWNDTERDRIWSSQLDATLVLRLAPGLHPSRLTATIESYHADRDRRGPEIDVDGKRSLRFPVRTGGPLEADTAIAAPGRTIVLRFHGDFVGSPSAIDGSPDPRRLAIALEGLDLR